MYMFAIFRRLHAPLACLAITCVISAGCQSREEVVALGQPLEAYRADNGSVLLGYFVQPKLKRDLAGWHWLVIEPDTSELLLKAASARQASDSVRTIAVAYKGQNTNARLIPPLLDQGLPNSVPPVIGNGGLTAQQFVWDQELGAVRLMSTTGTTLSQLRVSPGFETLVVWAYPREAVIDVLMVVAIAAAVTGLVLLGGSIEINSN